MSPGACPEAGAGSSFHPQPVEDLQQRTDAQDAAHAVDKFRWRQLEGHEEDHAQAREKQSSFPVPLWLFHGLSTLLLIISKALYARKDFRMCNHSSRLYVHAQYSVKVIATTCTSRLVPTRTKNFTVSRPSMIGTVVNSPVACCQLPAGNSANAAVS